MDVISHLKDQWPVDDEIMMIERISMFAYGFVKFGDEIDGEFDEMDKL